MDDTPESAAPDDAPAIGAADRILAGILLAGSLALAYVCADVLAGGGITRALTRRSAA